MRKFVMAGFFAIAIVGLAFAADRDRHASYTDPKAPAAAEQCKGFYGTDDNLTPCNDFCSDWRTSNQGSTCACDDGKCPADDH
jgi:hypothetical protein